MLTDVTVLEQNDISRLSRSEQVYFAKLAEQAERYDGDYFALLDAHAGRG